MAYPAVIFPEDDVENPMQSVLDAPVPADGPSQDGRIVVAAGKEVADLGFDLDTIAMRMAERLNTTPVSNAAQGRGRHARGNHHQRR